MAPTPVTKAEAQELNVFPATPIENNLSANKDEGSKDDSSEDDSSEDDSSEDEPYFPFEYRGRTGLEVAGQDSKKKGFSTRKPPKVKTEQQDDSSKTEGEQSNASDTQRDDKVKT